MSRRRPRPAWAAGPGDFDRPPDEVIERAKAAYQRRTTGPVAAIVSDAVGPHGERRLRFEHGLRAVDLVVSNAAGRWDLRGRTEPPVFRVELELEASPLTIAEDATGGAFAFEGVPGGVMRLRLVAVKGAEALVTDWFRA